MSPILSLIIGSALAATAPSPAPVEMPAATEAAPVHSAGKSEEATLAKVTNRYRTAKAATMKVNKTLKIGLLGEERKSSGEMWMSKGQLRLELDGTEKTLLVVNKKNLWAVTYPPADFKDAQVQVIKADTGSAKAKSQALTGLLGAGGFAKTFKSTGVKTQDDGTTAYFLQPVQEHSDFKRAQVRVSKDGKSIVELKYWDERDNETTFEFSETKFGGKVDAKKFQFTPPANADVMTL